MPLITPQQAINAVVARLAPLDAERVELSRASGRILAEPVISDRPSPPADVSAMDGYAVRLADLRSRRLPVGGEVATGHASPPLTPGEALRIFTGGAVPPQAEAVIPRELVREDPDWIELPADLSIRPRQHIRRRGDNLASGRVVAESGEPVTPAVAAALAAFGYSSPLVRRRPRLAIIVTGDELMPVESSPRSWQLRESNGAMLSCLFSNIPWIEPSVPRHAKDDPKEIRSALLGAMEESDAILLSGGVSMGDHDHVPDAIKAVGSEIIFHKIAIRPGKPLLGAVGPGNRVIFGLPGNPLSALTTARRFAGIALRRLAGISRIDPPPACVELGDDGESTLPLWWYRPVKLIGPGRAELVQSKGSGDLVSAARGDGFVELAPDEKTPGRFPYYSWSMA